jgi:hypothetical protein
MACRPRRPRSHSNRPRACSYLANVEAGFCDRGSGWACNELGIIQAKREADYAGSAESIRRGCALGFSPACANGNAIGVDGALTSAPPTPADLPIVLRGSKGPIADQSPSALYALACRESWLNACGQSKNQD